MKLTPPVIMAGVAGVILAATAATFLMDDRAVSENEEEYSVTVGRKHVTSQQLSAEQTQGVALNEIVPDLDLTDLNGKAHRLSEWRGQPVLFIFTDTVCPCVKSYRERVHALHKTFAKDGLQIVNIYPDANETPAQIRRYVEKQGYPGIAVKDDDQKLLRLFNAKCTTETFLLDGEGKLRYHGRIDDNIYKPKEVKVRDLQNALTAVLANRVVETPETETYGCEFVLLQKAPDAARQPT